MPIVTQQNQFGPEEQMTGGDRCHPGERHELRRLTNQNPTS
jgi:hypothetical protein